MKFEGIGDKGALLESLAVAAENCSTVAFEPIPRSFVMGCPKPRSKKTGRRTPPPAVSPDVSKQWRWWPGLSAVLIIGLVFWIRLHIRSQPEPPQSAEALAAWPTLAELSATSPQQLKKVDVALMDLRCAEGLPGAEHLDVPSALAKLDQFAKHVEDETIRNLHQYREHPDAFQNSEAYFRLLTMIVVLQEDFSMHYDPRFIKPPSAADGNDLFGTDAKDLFIHGLLEPPMVGTCASMPVLYTAIGRRLGYPLYLASAKEHLFFRWEDGGTRLNGEGTAHGFTVHDDDYYKTWPFPITDEEIMTQGYLKSMTPSEELAAFLSARGGCLEKAHRVFEAGPACAAAARLAPNVRAYQRNCQFVQREAINLRSRQIDQIDELLDAADRSKTLPAMIPAPYPAHP